MRLDRFYASKNNSNRVLKANIFPNGFTDHHLCMIEMSVKKSQPSSYYWHFNLKLLHDSNFCDKFGLFWSKWQEQKSDYEDLVQWWEVGKAQIRIFCQNYTAHSNRLVKNTIKILEREITEIEEGIIEGNSEEGDQLKEKKTVLASLFNERAKGALIRARFSSIREIDAPSSYYFNLERKEGEIKLMLHLKLPNGILTTNPKEMRNHAKNFYTDLFEARDCDIHCMDDLLRDLPKLTDDQRQWLDADIQLDEISEAVKKLSNGRSPGIDGLPSEFYKQFWTLLKDDILDVFRVSYRKNELPTSSIFIAKKSGSIFIAKKR